VVEKLSLYRANLHFAPPKARLVAIPWRLDGPLHKVSTSKHHSPPKGSKMNVLKNFEALFVVTLGLACAATYSLDDAETTQAPAQASYTAPAAARNMQVVVVSAKRMTAEQKKQSLLEESKTALAADSTAASKI
jgi:hypothetical protein